MPFLPAIRTPMLLSGLGLLLIASGLPLQAAPSQKISSGDAEGERVTQGEHLFLAKCAGCHGVGGKGGKAYGSQLKGDLSQAELAGYLHSAMPPKPKHCSVAEAGVIAEYMYGAFYSSLAQERIRPARVELARLTVRQYQNAVSDLISGFNRATPNSREHGLRGEYFKGRSRDQRNRVIQRVDPQVDFDFGTGAPSKEGFDPRNFSIAWSGSVLAPDTGEYEFSIHAKHSCQLWINNSRYPVVDGEVRSAGDADPKGTVTLLGGRAYTVYMVFTKATQGVESQDKSGSKPVPESYVSLRWRRPNHVAEPIPSQFLFPDGMPRTYVVTTPFPPDDRSQGYERGDSVSKDWDDATTNAALEAASYVSKNLPDVTGIQENAKDREKRLKDYCKSFLEFAFRRPLTPELEQTYISHQFAVAANLEMAVKRVLFLGLVSPRFLYREVGNRHDDAYVTAAQLSFGLWDTIPSPTLENAAKSGQLVTADQIRQQAELMMEDNRAWSKLRQFLLLWLKVDEVPDLVKNAQDYPEFDAAVASDLRTSLELYLEKTAWEKDSDYRELMLSTEQFLNGRLAQIYGVKLPKDAPFQTVELDPDSRAGVLTHPYLLSRFAYLDASDPIHRGLLVERNLLGRTLKPPPANFAPLAASSHPELTTRERVSLQTKPQFCASCHGVINPLGFTMEKFDAIGRVRTVDHGKPIDASGFYRAKSGQLVKFRDARDLAKYLATSEDSRAAFVEKLFLNVAKQPVLAFGRKTLSELESSFVKDEYSIRKLLVTMAVVTASPHSEKH